MIIKRLGFGLLTLFAISLLITVGMEFLAGDVCTEMLGQMAHPDTIAACRAELNLDRPVHIRYADWVWNLLHGDMGVSLANRREVSELINRRIGNTLFLAGLAALVSVALAIGLGGFAVAYTPLTRRAGQGPALLMLTHSARNGHGPRHSPATALLQPCYSPVLYL